MKAAVFGLGNMGEAACYAMTKLGFEVHGVDSVPNKCTDMLNKDYCKTVIWGDEKWEYILQLKPDVVLCCLPYHQNYEVASFCITNGFRYCDLGGNVLVSEKINSLAQKHAIKPVFTDLGVAPGLVNILTEKMVEEFPVIPDNVIMACGGYGIDDGYIYPSFYSCNWSIDGLVNEYFNDCLVLENGKIVSKPGLSDVMKIASCYEQEVLVNNYCFNTSGGIGTTLNTLKELGVKNCSYKTIRPYEHLQFLIYLRDTLKLNRKEIIDILKKSCIPLSSTDSLKIIIYVYNNKNNLSMKKDINYTRYPEDKFTTMQQFTSFSMASVAKLMAEGVMDYVICPKYGHVVDNFNQFNESLERLGIYNVD